ncbi:MAG: tyrosine-type recombinase/integrase [Actinomycetota bacterium]|nr:tyrosine-type recombinase/integrase [Actinomycetota bacterium]
MTLAPVPSVAIDLVDEYREHITHMPVAADYRRTLAVTAERFLSDHPDLDAWMQRPLESRLAELSRRSNAWPVIVLAMLSGRCRADKEFLIAKRFGHSAGRTVALLYPSDVHALHEAASRLGRSDAAFNELLGRTIPLVIAAFGVPVSDVEAGQIEELVAFVDETPLLTEPMRRSTRGRLFSLRQLMFESGMLDAPPPRQRCGGPATREQRMQIVAAPALRRSLLAYIEARSAVLRPKTVGKLTSALGIFGEFLTERFPEVTSLRKIERRHIEAYLAWSATRTCRGSHDSTKTVGPFVPAHAAITLRNFFDDITAWGWAEAPKRRIVFATDIPRQPTMLPRALPPDVDRALMAAVNDLDDPFARAAITILRHTGLRRGELLDLELDCIMDFGPSGTWLRVPLGKLNDERAVPLDAVALDALAGWMAQRSPQRSLPHPRDGRLCDFVFVERGQRLGPTRIQLGLAKAVEACSLSGSDGQPLRVVAHQLRHTWATELVNAGMSLQALMTLLGHRTPEMTMRYARLSSPTLRAAYDQAVGKVARRIPVAPAGRPAVPDRVSWLAAEMLKTRVAHGYCARELAAEACPYANVCETCPNFVTASEFVPAIEHQLTDLEALRDDATQRGWDAEVRRHERVIESLQGHLRRLKDR